MERAAYWVGGVWEGEKASFATMGAVVIKDGSPVYNYMAVEALLLPRIFFAWDMMFVLGVGPNSQPS